MEKSLHCFLGSRDDNDGILPGEITHSLAVIGLRVKSVMGTNFLF